jgi:hypothetical protein
MKSMKKISIIAISIAFLSWSCGKDFLSSLQNNPNAPTTAAATPALVLPGALAALVNVVNGTGTNGSYEWPAVWMGYWNYAPGYSFNPGPQNYVMTSGSPQVWDNYYGILANLNFVIQQTTGVTKNTNYHDISEVLEALCFKNLVDVYNDIPYNQALKAQADFYPAYDHASDIYDSLVVKLDNAIASMQADLGNGSVNTPSTDDILFGGNMQDWIWFANSVKLSMLIQQSNVSAKQAFLTSEASKTASAGFLTTDALINPGFTSAQPNIIWANFGVGPSGALNTYFTFVKGNQASIDFYKKTNDSRVGWIYVADSLAPNNPLYFSQTLPINFAYYNANYTGTQNQLPSGRPVSSLGPGVVKAANAPSVMMTAAESYFEQAEAIIYGWLPGGPAAAQTAYQNGITASYEYLNVGGSTATADAAAMAYYGQNIGYVAFPLGASVDSLDHTIIEQKWAALNGISNCVPYNDWRRTYSAAMNSGYPIVPVSISNSNTAPHMPFRYLYPTEEADNNNQSWQNAGGPSIDPFNNKIFWQP